VGFLLLGYAALRALELSPRPSPALLERAERPAARTVAEAWRTRVILGGTAVLARLRPLHDEPELQGFRAEALRRRYGLPPGRPFRLYLRLEEPGAAPLVVSSARVGDDLVPLAARARPLGAVDPVHALLAAQPAPLEGERARAMLLWGALPEAAEARVLELSDGANAAAALLEPDDETPAPRWYAGRAPREEGERSLAEEVARLEHELQRERTRRAEREQAFLEFSRLLSELPGAEELGLAPPESVPEPPPPSAEELARAKAETAARARAVEIARALAVLMRLEGLRGLDLLEAGTLQAGPPAAIGPVVFRCLDERGLLAGSVRAERLRLEASAAAHTLTLVLEQGFESRGGERVPFADGVRRITLRDVDPGPWLRECPELFDPGAAAAAGDDGLWRLADVRRELNRLLALDTSSGWYRLHSLGGVRGASLLDVQLEELEPGGRSVRRWFADALDLAFEDGVVVLELRDGASVRGGEKQPFRDGRLRIVVPAARATAWRGALLPGLAPAPPRPETGEARAGER
jgi:hypothetical protein